MRTVIVYIHGLWLPGMEALLLRRRVAQALAAESRLFSYPSIKTPFEANVRSLAEFLTAVPADTLHLVAHSMGGLLILKLFELGLGSTLPRGRVVLTGSPVRGSRSATRLARLPFGSLLLGRTARATLLSRAEPSWAGHRELGVIAGDHGVGLGRLLGGFDRPNDGTVCVDETELPGATDRIRLHVSHSGMMLSRQVASQTAAFLQHGRFETGPASSGPSHPTVSDETANPAHRED